MYFFFGPGWPLNSGHVFGKNGRFWKECKIMSILSASPLIPAIFSANLGSDMPSKLSGCIFSLALVGPLTLGMFLERKVDYGKNVMYVNIISFPIDPCHFLR